MQSFRNLKVWSKAHSLTLSIYASTRAFPKEELYSLTNQISRASASIGMNLAEGCCRKSDAEMARFTQIAMGSASELEYQLLLARDLQYLDIADYEQLDAQVVRGKENVVVIVENVITRELKADG